MIASRTTVYGLVALTSVIGLALPAAMSARPGQITSSAQSSTGSQRGQTNFCGDDDVWVFSESTDIIDLTGESLVCSGSSGTSSQAYGRSHDLSNLDTGGNDISLQCVTWGMKQAVEDLTATVNVYSDDDGNPASGLAFIGSIDGTISANDQPFYQTFEFDGLVVPAGILFIELIVDESTSQNSHSIAANDAGQSSPSWIRTLDGSCSVGNWTDLANIGYADVHWVEQIEVAIAVPADPCNDPLPECAGDISGGDGNPDGVVGVDDVLAVIANYNNSGDGTFRPTGDVAPAPNGDCVVNVDDLLEVIAQFGNECAPPAPSLVMNELRTNHSGTDTNEYFEIAGTPGDSLDGYAWIVIGDGSGDSPLGHLETVICLDGQSIGSNGYYSQILENVFENNDPVTHLLVRGLDLPENCNLNGTIDLDLDDDGTLDSTPWEETVDCVALIGAGEDEVVYCDVTIGPDDIYTAIGGYRCPDITGDWVMAPFNLGCLDTPGEANACSQDDADKDGVPDCADNCVDTFNPDQADCDGDGEGDACDLGIDCNSNQIPDDCETDCNLNGSPDDCDIDGGLSSDCNSNGIPDECENDCNGNGVADECDIDNGDSQDSDGNGVPDECEGSVVVINEIHADPASDLSGDANSDGVRNGSEDEFIEIVNKSGGDLYLAGGTISDAVAVRHTFPPETPVLADGCAIIVFGGGDPATFANDFGGSVVQVASTGFLGFNNGGDTVTLADANGTVIDSYEYGSDGGDNQSITRFPDVFGESFFKHSEVALDGSLFSPGTTIDGDTFGGADCGDGGTAPDADGDGIPDDFDNCDLFNPDQLDCNNNGVGDVCDLADGTSQDEDGNGIPDECEEVAGGAWINEFHYDNSGSDVDEMIEVVLLDGTDAANCTVTLYNGNGGNPYGSSLVVGTDFTAGDSGAGYTIYSIILPSNGLQNGAPDGICLDIGGSVAHFISYEGTITAASGPAAGMTSTDVVLVEGSQTPVGSSLGLTGDGGGSSGDYTWATQEATANPGSLNPGQTITP